MKLLLDTHVLIWLGTSSNLLPPATTAIINNPANEIFVSMVTIYEVAIKMNIGKLKIGKSVLRFYQDAVADNIEILPISPTYLATFANLPLFPNHKDPFDRLIIATALTDNLSIITADAKFSLYKDLVTLVW